MGSRQPEDVTVDLTRVTIAPEIQAWAEFKLNGRRQPLDKRMAYTEEFTRNHVENMALMGGCVPPGGFSTIVPAEPGE